MPEEWEGAEAGSADIRVASDPVAAAVAFGRASKSHLALAKFAEADKCAPNWGRLHLKWGEAHYCAGRKDGARAEFALAAALDLTPLEISELSRWGSAHA